MTLHTTLEGRFAQVVDDLYAGALDDVAWDRAILGMTDLLRASAAALLAYNPSNGAVLRSESHRIDPSVLRDYQRHWSYEDTRLGACIPVPPGSPVDERTLRLPGWRRSAILNEFLLPADLPHFLPAWLHKSETKSVALSFQGSRKRGPFEAQDLETYRRMLPHVRRALEIRERLERAQIRAHCLATLLDSSTNGVVVLDAAGKVIEANATARQLFGADRGIHRRCDGTLSLRQPAANELSRWIASGTPPATLPEGLLRVSGPHGSPLSVLVTPLPQLNDSWIGATGRWLVVISDPDRPLRVSPELIARDLGLSAAEANVAALIVTGSNLVESARRLGISRHTARNQLKSIFRKTGFRSQADLIRRVLVGPGARL